MLEDYSAGELPSTEPLASPELLATFLVQHYRRILDEPIPALNDQTPRECSRKNDQHGILIQWLKGLENNNAVVPHMAHYDFTWMWEELGLKPLEKLS